MSRASTLISVFVLGSVGLAIVVSRVAVAQDETPPFLLAHPLVGAWDLTTDPFR